MSAIPDEITHLYMVRHAETDYNRNRMVQGRGVDVPLNNLGISQASGLSRRFQSLKFDAVYTSTLLRAVQTARIILGENKHLPFTKLRDLEEMSFGIYEGRSWSAELGEVFNLMKSEWSRGNYDYRIEGGETIQEVEERGRKALNYIVNKHQGEHVVVVAHGRFLRILLASILDEYGLERMEDLEMKNTSFNHIVYSNGRFDAKLLQSTTHLDLVSE